MLVKIPPTKTSCPLVTTLRTSLFGAGFHVRSTVPFGLTRTKLFRVTSLTEVKNPAMITFPSSWTAMSRTKPPLDSFKFGNAAGEVCARTDESWKQKINAITPVMVRLIRPLTVALKLWEKPPPRHLIPFVEFVAVRVLTSTTLPTDERVPSLATFDHANAAFRQNWVRRVIRREPWQANPPGGSWSRSTWPCMLGALSCCRIRPNWSGKRRSFVRKK